MAEAATSGWRTHTSICRLLRPGNVRHTVLALSTGSWGRRRPRISLGADLQAGGVGVGEHFGGLGGPHLTIHTVPKAIILQFQPLLSRVEPISIPPKHSPFLNLLTVLPSKTAHRAAHPHRLTCANGHTSGMPAHRVFHKYIPRH